MEISLIEKLDRSRYNLIQWFAFGWAVWYGTFIIKDLLNSEVVKIILVGIGLVGWVVWTINLIKVVRLGRRVNANVELKSALNDELHQYNTQKSFIVGYVATLFTIITLIVLATFLTFSTLVVLQIILYVSVLAVLIASLLCNRS